MGKLGVTLSSTVHSVFSSLVGNGLLQNNIFDLCSNGNRDGCFEPYMLLRSNFLSHGVEINTADVNRVNDVQFELHMDAQQRINSKIPCYSILYESPQIRPINQSKPHLAKYRRIFTWRDDLVDGQRYIKLNLPNKIVANSSGDWSDRAKLCCLIAGNKSVFRQTPLELYTDRVKTIRWFEEHAAEDFDLFGSGWNEPASRPGIAHRVVGKFRNYLSKDEGKLYFPSYRGKVDSKLETLQKCRFSICYENIRDLPGYITEKIFDSFFAGCIPVYWGASNVTTYVPEDCFIDRRKFENHEALYNFMASMTKTEYTAYQERIAVFLSSERARPFSTEAFAETIVNAIVSDLGIAV